MDGKISEPLLPNLFGVFRYILTTIERHTRIFLSAEGETMAKKTKVPVPTQGRSKPYASGTPKNGTKTTKGSRVSGYKSGGSYPTSGDNPYGGKA